jgi:PDZ domain-containing secreted protein
MPTAPNAAPGAPVLPGTPLRRAAVRLLGARAGAVGIVLAMVMFVFLASFGMSDSGYGSTGPGPLLRLSGSVSGDAVDESERGADRSGWFAMTTVQVTELNWGELIFDTVRLRQVSELDNDLAATVGVQMDLSKNLAAIVALDLAGRPVESVPGALVVSVAPSSPAEAAGIVPGAVIIAVNRSVVDTPETLRRAVQRSEVVELLVLARGETVTVTVPVESGRIGVEVLPGAAVDVDELLAVDTGTVGGPSAGLMMTLAFLDALHPGDLTAARAVAGTGTVTVDGAVGPISGARFKVEAAIQSGMDVFFTPVEHRDEVTDAAAGRIEVVAVSSVREAVDYLCSIGADDTFCSR